ncbi:hypothetical protein [Microbacterium hydrocarbonoxydans]|uniref:hypothetical protein n=1 Tax=Microbacterium hydrocarbonoxydans TaxID=273678 RepID=UPI003D981E3B
MKLMEMSVPRGAEALVEQIKQTGLAAETPDPDTVHLTIADQTEPDHALEMVRRFADAAGVEVGPVTVTEVADPVEDDETEEGDE